MKFFSFLNNKNDERLGILVEQTAYDLGASAQGCGWTLPTEMNAFLSGGEANMKLAKRLEAALQETPKKGVVAEIKKNLAPVPHPPTCRDGYAFRQHVETMRRSRGAEMIPEFDQFPVFYFTNHHAIVGEGDIIVEIDHLQRLDFELELAVVIGKRGRNIPSSDAESYIAGFTIMNDFTCRYFATEEMKLTMGPAKGKDFATALGPWLVTPDELENYRCPGPLGSRWELQMRAYHNGKLVTDGNAINMTWTFAEIIERAAYGVDLYPGEVIGSGTVGRGCFAEQNLVGEVQAKEKGEKFTPTWLKPGDTSELEITGLGRLNSRITRSNSDFSILAKRKNFNDNA